MLSLLKLSIKCLSIRRLRLFLKIDAGPRRGPSDFRHAAVDIVWLTRFFYLFVAFLMNTGYLHLASAWQGRPTQPLWPIELLNSLLGTGWVERLVDMPAIPVVCSLIGLLAVIFPGSAVLRIAVFLYLLIVTALRYSYGGLNHFSHFLIYVSFALIFLPSAIRCARQMSRKDAMNCVMVFWFAQSILLLSYFLAGFWKIWYSELQLLSSDGFVRILLSRMVADIRPVPLMTPLLVKHGVLAQLIFLAVVYIQLAAIFVLFRPHLHRLFGVVLILFHYGTDWLLSIAFYEFTVVLGLFLVFSPFAPRRFSWLGTVQSLPVLGFPFRSRGRVIPSGGA